MPDADLMSAAPASEAAGPPRTPTLADRLMQMRYRYVPDHVVGELLAKRWIDNVAPFTCLLLVVALFGTLIPGFFSGSSLANAARQLGEFGLVVMAMMAVMIGAASTCPWARTSRSAISWRWR